MQQTSLEQSLSWLASNELAAAQAGAARLGVPLDQYLRLSLQAMNASVLTTRRHPSLAAEGKSATRKMTVLLTCLRAENGGSRSEFRAAA